MDYLFAKPSPAQKYLFGKLKQARRHACYIKHAYIYIYWEYVVFLVDGKHYRLERRSISTSLAQPRTKRQPRSIVPPHGLALRPKRL